MIRAPLENNRSEKGQSLVEFAVSLVILLIILAGIIDLGRLFFYFIAMRDAAQEGVMYGIIDPAGYDQIFARTQALLTDDSDVRKYDNTACLDHVPPIDTANDSTICITVSINGTAYDESPVPAAACAGNGIKVEVRAPAFRITMPFLASILNRNSIDLHTSVTGTILTPSCPD
jgi:hypothetical protein